jgi:NADH dehydrogenase FAD-containing subunit
MARSTATIFDRLLGLYEDSQSQHKPNVVVVGSGWGAAAFVDNIDKSKYNLQIISQDRQRLNQPRMIHDFSPTYKKLKVEPVIDKCMAIDRNQKWILGHNAVYAYDYLVLATGSEPNDFGTKGVQKYCYMFKSASDLERLKSQLDTPRNVTVIGAGPTGIELAFKLQSLGHTVTLLEASTQILPGFSQQMQTETSKLLESHKIAVHLNTKITEVTESSIHTPNGPVQRDQICIWTCGVKPTEFVRKLTPEGRQLKTDDTLKFDSNIYALGDIVAARGPPTAQNAKQMGHYLASHFNNNFAETPYKYSEKGRVIDIESTILVEYMGHVIHLPPLFRAVLYHFTD